MNEVELIHTACRLTLQGEAALTRSIPCKDTYLECTQDYPYALTLHEDINGTDWAEYSVELIQHHTGFARVYRDRLRWNKQTADKFISEGTAPNARAHVAARYEEFKGTIPNRFM